MSQPKKSCIIKNHVKIRELLYTRFCELGLPYIDIITDARDRGRKIQKASFSRYINQSVGKGGELSQSDILWLCVRYGIKVETNVEQLPYDEKECLKRLKKEFPNGQ